MAIINNLTDVWNNVATTFTAVKMNVTDTTSAAGSKLVDLLVSGASKFSVTKTGDGLFSGNVGVVSLVGSTETAFLVKKTPSATNLFIHGFADESLYTSLGTNGGYACFSASIGVAGTTPFNHFYGFQFLPTIGGTHTIDLVGGVFAAPTINTGTTVTQLFGAYLADFIGTGVATNNYGVYIAPIVKGVNNWGLYSAGTVNANYIGGPLGVGVLAPISKLHIAQDVLTIAGNNQLQLLISGVANANQQLRIGYDTPAGIGAIQAETVGASFDKLVLNPLGGNVGVGTLNPGQKLEVNGNVQSTGYQRTVPVTVATLVAAATAGAGAWHFVTDSTVVAAGNFGAAVVGVGANSVPVYCDGTNWRIG